MIRFGPVSVVRLGSGLLQDGQYLNTCKELSPCELGDHRGLEPVPGHRGPDDVGLVVGQRGLTGNQQLLLLIICNKIHQDCANIADQLHKMYLYRIFFLRH